MTMRVERRGVSTKSATGDIDSDENEERGRTPWVPAVVDLGDTVGVLASTAQSVSERPSSEWERRGVEGSHAVNRAGLIVWKKVFSG